jgi:hypothetical protein
VPKDTKHFVTLTITMPYSKVSEERVGEEKVKGGYGKGGEG